jgi:GntR family transcriptional repressor for pyruvate dehydrogenase complex
MSRVLSSAGRQIADVLRETIMSTESSEDEWFLGSEEDMVQQLGVSRATLRQAARVLEQEQILHVRRGVRGGFYGRRPTFQVVAHTASLFLRSQDATYADIVRSQMIISTSCAQYVAVNCTKEDRRRVATWYSEHLPGQRLAAVNGRAFFPICAGFHSLLTELSDNVAMRLFMDVLMELARPIALQAFLYHENIESTARDHDLVGQAILAGEGDRAAKLMADHLEAALGWADQRRRIGDLPISPADESPPYQSNGQTHN